MSSFTNQRPRVATADEVQAPWRGTKNGEHFRCYLCGHRFKVGDVWRWVYAGGSGCLNFMTCESCDGDDVLERWVAMNKELKDLRRRYWWYFERG